MASFLGAFITVGFPVAVTTYFLIGWLLHSGRIARVASHKELDAHIRDIKKARKENKKNKQKEQEEEPDFAFKKWLGFGAGFFGSAALYTYAYIEVGEVISFVFKMLNPANWTFTITIDLIINFVINSIMNLVSAFTWFLYWGGDNDGGARIAFNFLFAYLGYALGVRLANQHADEDFGHPRLWRWLRGQRGQLPANGSADGTDD